MYKWQDFILYIAELYSSMCMCVLVLHVYFTLTATIDSYEAPQPSGCLRCENKDPIFFSIEEEHLSELLPSIKGKKLALSILETSLHYYNTEL